MKTPLRNRRDYSVWQKDCIWLRSVFVHLLSVTNALWDALTEGLIPERRIEAASSLTLATQEATVS